MNQHTNIKILISWIQKGMSKRRKTASGYSQQVDGGQPTSGRFPTQLPDSRRTHAATQIISYQIIHSLFRTFLRLRCCCCCRCRFLRASFCFVGLLLRLSALSIAIRPSTEVQQLPNLKREARKQNQNTHAYINTLITSGNVALGQSLQLVDMRSNEVKVSF